MSSKGWVMRKREQFEQFAKVQEDFKSSLDENKNEVDKSHVSNDQSDKIPEDQINEV